MPNATLTLNAYAKINLTLDVFSKRADGYHDIASVMQTISLHDTLHFTRRAERPESRLPVTRPTRPMCPPMPPISSFAPRRLVMEAAQEQGHDPVTAASEIHLVKRIPSQAGLGGGSSDAAAALRGVQTLFGLTDTDLSLKAACRAVGFRRAVFPDGRHGDGAGPGRKTHFPARCPELCPCGCETRRKRFHRLGV